MKKIKNFLKRNLKYSIAFIIGILVHLVVYASTTPLYTSNQIGYDNSNSGLEVDNVKDALDALYNKAATCDFGSGEDDSGGDSNTAAAYLIANESSLVNVADAYRYVGSSPTNYVWFNCSSLENQSSSTCEKWRIVGVYGDQLKIIKNTPSKTYQVWNSSSNNTWSGSTIQTYLDNTYWGIIQTPAKGLVNQNATWYIGAAVRDATASEAYTSAKTATWTPHKIGLLASYEYLYAAEGSNCYTTSGYTPYSVSCAPTNWLWPILTNNDSIEGWLINSYSGSSISVLEVDFGGSLLGEAANASVAVSPVVYLGSNVTITGGNGEEGTPYELGMTS